MLTSFLLPHSCSQCSSSSCCWIPHQVCYDRCCWIHACYHLLQCCYGFWGNQRVVRSWWPSSSCCSFRWTPCYPFPLVGSLRRCWRGWGFLRRDRLHWKLNLFQSKNKSKMEWKWFCFTLCWDIATRYIVLFLLSETQFNWFSRNNIVSSIIVFGMIVLNVRCFHLIQWTKFFGIKLIHNYGPKCLLSHSYHRCKRVPFLKS